MEVFLIPSQMYSKVLEPAPSVGLDLLPWELVAMGTLPSVAAPLSSCQIREDGGEDISYGSLAGLISVLFSTQVGVWYLSKENHMLKLGNKVHLEAQVKTLHKRWKRCSSVCGASITHTQPPSSESSGLWQNAMSGSVSHPSLPILVWMATLVRRAWFSVSLREWVPITLWGWGRAGQAPGLETQPSFCTHGLPPRQQVRTSASGVQLWLWVIPFSFLPPQTFLSYPKPSYITVKGSAFNSYLRALMSEKSQLPPREMTGEKPAFPLLCSLLAATRPAVAILPRWGQSWAFILQPHPGYSTHGLSCSFLCPLSHLSLGGYSSKEKHS